MKRRQLAIAAMAGALVLSAAGAARADERTEARRHFRAGLQLIAQHQYDAGIRELEAAYAILPHPNVLYNIARAYNDAGDTEHALQYLRRYLQNDVPDRAEVEAVVERLENRMRQQGAAAGGGATATTTTTTTTTTSTTTGATGTGATGTGAETGPATTGSPTGTGTTAVGPALPALPPGASAADQYRQLATMLLQLADQAQGTRTTATVSSPTQPAPGHTTVPPANNLAEPAPTNGAALGARAPSSDNGTAGAVEAAEEGNEETYEERVVTASRAAQSPLDAPNATGVITAQDIRLSGITNVADLLRRVAGVDIMTLDAGDTQVSIRGFNQRISNKVLVLIDGRSINLDFLGITIWNSVFPAVEEIERIEVIRGPGSALYGADAFTGIVNIITRAPGEQRNQITFGGGSGQWLRGAYLASGHVGDFSYRASVQYEQRATYRRLVPDNDLTYTNAAPSGDLGYVAPRLMIEGQYRVARDVVVRAGLGGYAGTVFFTASGLLRQDWTNMVFVQPFAQIDAGGFSGRVFWNRVSATAGPLIEPQGGQSLRAQVQQDVVDVDLQYSVRNQLAAGVRNTLQLGAGYRYKHISWNYLDADHDINFASAYLQDTLNVGRWFSAVASARVDYHPLLANLVLSPRLALIAHPTPRSSIRLSGGTAFRTPTFLELYFDLYYPTPIPGLTVSGLGSEVSRDLLGTDRLRPETALSGEIGYMNQELDWLQFELNGFVTRGTDLINLGAVVFDPLGASTTTNRAVNAGTRAFVNEPGEVWVAGVEVGARVSPQFLPGLDLFANYTYAYTWYRGASPLAAGDQRTPQHKLNAGIQLRTRVGLDFEAAFHYVSSQVWLEPVFDPVYGSRDVAFPLKDYFVLSARAGYRMLGDRLELGVVGSNLADVRPESGHMEHPFGARLNARVLGTVSYRF